MTILILGGGASGMMAAIAAASFNTHRVVLLERQARVGKKLLATGNGRCNLSNRNVACTHYHGADAAFCMPALTKFGIDETLAFFEALGLVTVTEASGRVYPFSDQANSVVDVLRFALEARGVELHTECEVHKLWKRREGYLLKTSTGDFTGERLIVATGGVAGLKPGTAESGYEILEALGHQRSALSPALVQLITAGNITRALKGIRAEAQISLYNGTALIAAHRGEVQFTESGISGPAVFEISRAASTAHSGLQIALDLLPHLNVEALTVLLKNKITQFPQRGAEDILTGILHNRLGKTCVKAAGISAEKSLSSLSASEISHLCTIVKRFELIYVEPQGMAGAQVTAGGILTDDFNAHTLESRLARGVFACGEVLDIDGDCGGYNLQWAWSSGYLAGCAAAQEDCL